MDDNNDIDDDLLRELMNLTPSPVLPKVTFPLIVLPRVWQHKLGRYLRGHATSGEKKFWEQLQVRWNSQTIQDQIEQKDSFPSLYTYATTKKGSHKLNDKINLWTHYKTTNNEFRVLILRNTATFGHPYHLVGYLSSMDSVFMPGFGFTGKDDIQQIKSLFCNTA